MAAAARGARSIPLLIGVAILVFVLDQLTKTWAVERLSDGDIELIFDWRLHLVRNPAAAFSLGEGLGPLIGILALGVVAALVVMSRDYHGRAPTVFVGMIVGGALGNIADRAFREGDGFLGGEVVDFVDVRFWPVFNVADSAVVVGVILLAGYSVFIEPRHHRADPEADTEGAPDAGTEPVDGTDRPADDQPRIDNS